MKSILRNHAGAFVIMAAVIGMMGCTPSTDKPEEPPVVQTVATPTFSVEAGELDIGTKVTVSCGTEGAVIYYTTNGYNPSPTSTVYSEPISVTEGMTIKAFAVKDGMKKSETASVTYTVKPLVPECVLVSGGTVTGSGRFDNYPGVFTDGRTVTLSSFYMGKYEVTQAQYRSVMGGQKVSLDGVEYSLAGNPSLCTGSNEEYKIDWGKDHSNHPVEYVTWYDAVYYCNVLSEKEKLNPCYTINVKHIYWDHISDADVAYDNSKNGYRLPTEAEWEYAARGGDPEKDDWNYTFSGADKAKDTNYFDDVNTGLDKVGWYGFNNITGTTEDSFVTRTAEGKGTHEVGKKDPNGLEIFDMSGNVGEWCYDWYDEKAAVNDSEYTQDDKVVNPAGAATSTHRVLRGGYWGYYAEAASVSQRDRNMPGTSHYAYGFRVCRNAE